MSLAPHDVEALIREHQTLVRHFAKVQARCSDLAVRQAAVIAHLQAQAMRQRAALIARDSALAWQREDHAALEATIPGLPRRVVLAQRVEALRVRVQDLMRERLHWQRPPAHHTHAVEVTVLPADPMSGTAHAHAAVDVDVEEASASEQSLIAADLVICQTGCLSHGAYWRVQDHCKRTGKACMLVEQPDALRIVRIHRHDH